MQSLFKNLFVLLVLVGSLVGAQDDLASLLKQAVSEPEEGDTALYLNKAIECLQEHDMEENFSARDAADTLKKVRSMFDKLAAGDTVKPSQVIPLCEDSIVEKVEQDLDTITGKNSVSKKRLFRQLVEKLLAASITRAESSEALVRDLNKAGLHASSLDMEKRIAGLINDTMESKSAELMIAMQLVRSFEGKYKSVLAELEQLKLEVVKLGGVIKTLENQVGTLELEKRNLENAKNELETGLKQKTLELAQADVKRLELELQNKLCQNSISGLKELLLAAEAECKKENTKAVAFEDKLAIVTAAHQQATKEEEVRRNFVEAELKEKLAAAEKKAESDTAHAKIVEDALAVVQKDLEETKASAANHMLINIVFATLCFAASVSWLIRRKKTVA